MSRPLSTRNISSKSVDVFLSNLANRQTDRQTNKHGQKHTSSFVIGNNNDSNDDDNVDDTAACYITLKFYFSQLNTLVIT